MTVLDVLAQVGIQVAIWSSLLGTGAIAGMSLPAMITYAPLNAVIVPFVFVYSYPAASLLSGDGFRINCRAP